MSFELKDGLCEPCKFITFTSVKAEFVCDDCQERYCGQCSLDHSKFRVLRNHHISSLSSQSNCEESDYLIPVQTRNMNECLHDYGQQGGEYVQELYDRHDKPGMQTVGTERETYENLVFDTKYLHRKTGKGQDVVKYASVGENNTYTKEDVVEQKETEKPASVPHTFDVKVLDTDLARRIKGVSKEDIMRCVFQLTMEMSCLSLSFQKKSVFECAYHSVRRYGIKDGTISIEIGRKCEIGPGYLKVTTERPKELVDLFKTF